MMLCYTILFIIMLTNKLFQDYFNTGLVIDVLVFEPMVLAYTVLLPTMHGQSIQTVTLIIM